MSCLLHYAQRHLFFQPRIHPSVSCGPFRFFPNMWLVVPTTLHSLSDTAREFLFFIGSQAFSIPLFILSWWHVFSINTLMCFLLSCCFIIIVFLPVFLSQRDAVLFHSFNLRLWENCSPAKNSAEIGEFQYDVLVFPFINTNTNVWFIGGAWQAVPGQTDWSTE